MTTEEMYFAVFCIESLAEHLSLNGAEVYAKLSADSDLLDKYIVQHYDTLHTQGKAYIVNDIVEIMQKEGLLQ